MKSAEPCSGSTASRLMSQPKPQGKATLARGMKTLLCSLVFTAVFLLTGCGKAKIEANTPPESQQTNVSLAAAQVPTYSPAPTRQQAAPTVTPSGEADVAELQRALMRWMMRNRRRPASFEDFAATAGVPIPRPPAGKKYVITKDMHIELR